MESFHIVVGIAAIVLAMICSIVDVMSYTDNYMDILIGNFLTAFAAWITVIMIFNLIGVI